MPKPTSPPPFEKVSRSEAAMVRCITSFVIGVNSVRVNSICRHELVKRSGSADTDRFLAGGSHFSDDRTGGSNRIFGLENGTSNNNKIDAGFDGGPGRHDTLLIIAVTVRWTDAGSNDDKAPAATLPNSSDLMRRRNHAIHPRFVSQQRQAHHLSSHPPVDADPFEIVLIQTGQHGDSQQDRPAPFFLPAYTPHFFDSHTHHFETARRMNVEHFDTHASSLDRRFGYRIGYVVKFKIEKNLAAEFLNQAHRLRPSVSEQLLADLEHAHFVGKRLHQVFGLIEIVDIEGDNQTLAGWPPRPEQFQLGGHVVG